LNKSRF